MRYLRTFLKRWYLYMVPILVIPVAWTFYGYKDLLSYQCSTLLWVDKPIYLSDQDFGWSQYMTPAQNEAAAMTELLQSKTWVATVAARTDLANRLDLSSPWGVDAAYFRISGEVFIAATGVGPHALVLSVTDKDPRLALQLVQALQAQFTSDYENNRLQLDQQAIDFYQRQLATAQAQVTQDNLKVQEYIAQHPGVPPNNPDPALALLEQQLNQDQHSVSDLNARISGLRQDTLATSSADIFKVLDPPQLPTMPTISKSKLIKNYGGVGLAAALALVAVIVAGLTQLDRKVYSRADLVAIGEELDLDLPAIETVPIIAGIGGPARGRGDEEESAIEGILMPVLAVLPRLRASEMQQGLRQAIGMQGTIVTGVVEGEGRR